MNMPNKFLRKIQQERMAHLWNNKTDEIWEYA